MTDVVTEAVDCRDWLNPEEPMTMTDVADGAIDCRDWQVERAKKILNGVLFEAVKQGSLKGVTFLIERGANPTAESKCSRIPLEFAEYLANKNPEESERQAIADFLRHWDSEQYAIDDATITNAAREIWGLNGGFKFNPGKKAVQSLCTSQPRMVAPRTTAGRSGAASIARPRAAGVTPGTAVQSSPKTTGESNEFENSVKLAKEQLEAAQKEADSATQKEQEWRNNGHTECEQCQGDFDRAKLARERLETAKREYEARRREAEEAQKKKATEAETKKESEINFGEVATAVGSVALNFIPGVGAVRGATLGAKTVKAVFDVGRTAWNTYKAANTAVKITDTVRGLSADRSSNKEKPVANQSSSGSVPPPQNPKNNPKDPKGKDKDKPKPIPPKPPERVIPTKEMQETCWGKLKQSGEWRHSPHYSKPTLENKKTGQFLQKSIEKWELEAFNKREKHIGVMRP
ncbi:MAG: hypothetical protein LBF34_00395, partial [Puniceicoccales bacterium]|nr:hypothetical protein [Puniceicoccales bacterium]